jgi:hypothetical protein
VELSSLFEAKKSFKIKDLTYFRLVLANYFAFLLWEALLILKIDIFLFNRANCMDCSLEGISDPIIPGRRPCDALVSFDPESKK